jgi:hypothetical protein
MLTLAELMESTRNSKCQAAHYRIYAILALATDTSTFKSIPIDYNRSQFTVKVDVVWAVTNVVAHWMMRTSNA